MVQKKKKSEAGKASPLKAHILILEARFYEDIGDLLLEGAIAACDARGITYEKVTVPGALELPQALAIALEARPAKSRKKEGRTFDGAVALGCVIRGETAHYDIVCNNANHWLMHAAMQAHLPIGNAILTVETKEQAIVRAKGGIDGKGGDAVRACLSLIEMRRTMAEAQQ